MRSRMLLVVLGLVVAVPAYGQAPTAEQKKATVAYLQSLQKDSGGFAADKKPDTPATAPATSSAMRALKYFGGEVKNKDASAKFIKSCMTKDGFAATPDGKPDVRSNALGIMAAIECKEGFSNTDLAAAVVQLGSAKTFEEIRIAAAAIDTAKVPANQYATLWLPEINKLRNADGTYGKGDNVARDTGGAVAAVLRLGGTVENRDNVVKALKAGQRPDGGWSKDGTKSDLESTYRVLRAFVMLKEKPDIEACRKFIAGCRNDDGSYSVQPGQPGNVSATYFAGILSHWLDEMK